METSAEKVFRIAIAPFQHLLDDPTITEINVNGDGPDDVWVSGMGGRRQIDIVVNKGFVRAAINALATHTKRDANSNSEDAFISQKFGNLRVTGILSPISYKGDALAIRKHTVSVITLDDMVSGGGIDESAKEMMIHIVESGANFLVAGGTDAGKTTVLNAMLAHVPPRERVITIEDGVELNIVAKNNLRLLENKSSNVTVEKLLHGVLRTSPDRAICGEIRKKEEAVNFLDVMNSGHEGCCSTIHANSCQRALLRLERLLLQSGEPSQESARIGIASLIEYIIHFKKDKADSRRYLTGIINIKDYTKGDYVLETIHNGTWKGK